MATAHGNPQQPGEKRLGLLQFRQGEERTHEDLLGCLRGSIHAAQASVQVLDQGGLVALDKNPEHLRVLVPAGPDTLVI